MIGAFWKFFKLGLGFCDTFEILQVSLELLYNSTECREIFWGLRVPFRTVWNHIRFFEILLMNHNVGNLEKTYGSAFKIFSEKF